MRFGKQHIYILTIFRFILKELTTCISISLSIEEVYIYFYDGTRYKILADISPRFHFFSFKNSLRILSKSSSSFYDGLETYFILIFIQAWI